MCCLPMDQTLPPAGHSISAQGLESCTGAQLASRLRWIGDQLEKSRATGGRRNSKGSPGNNRVPVRRLFAACAAVQIAALLLLVRKRHL